MRRLTMVIMVLGGCASASNGGNPSGEDAGTTDDAGADGSITIDAAPDAVPIDAAPMLVTVTQSTSQVISSPNTVACRVDGGPTRENHFYRVFPLTDHGITGPFQVQSVQFGVETSAGGHSVTINVGTYGGAYAPGAAGLDPAQFAPIATTSMAIADGNAFMATAPIALTIPAGGKLMVELVSPNSNDLFFPGSNASGETYPSFIRSPQCDNSIKSFAAIGRPNVQLVMSVTGLH